MKENAKQLRVHVESIDSARDVRELGAALKDASQSLVGVSSMCLMPFGSKVSSIADATVFHEQHAVDDIGDALVRFFPTTQQELGDGTKCATERLFGLRKPIVDLNALFGADGLERTTVFNEFWRPYHIERQLLAPLAAGTRPLGYLCLGRTMSERPFRTGELERAAWLGRRALGALRRIGKASGELTHGILDALRSLPLPCALFDGSAALLWLSSAAESRLGLRLVEANITQLVRPTAGLLAWHAAVRRAFASGHGTIQEEDLLLQRLTNKLGDAMLVTQTHSDRLCAQRVERMRHNWRLTAREAEVLIELANGHSNKEVGSSLGCSFRTVEVHVASLLVKSGCSTRTELLARLWAGS